MASEVAAASINEDSIKDFHIKSNADIARTKIAQRVLGTDTVPLSQLRTWDARATNLPGTAASDDLGYITGTLGTDSPTVQTGDLKTAGATTRYAGFQVAVPNDFEDGQTLTIEVLAGMKTTVADGSATVDLQVYRSTEDGLVGSDICATSATSINSLTAATKSFTITPASLVAGDLLDVRLACAVTDTATGTAVIGRVVAIKVRSDRR